VFVLINNHRGSTIRGATSKSASRRKKPSGKTRAREAAATKSLAPISPIVRWTRVAVWPMMTAVIFLIAALAATYWWLFGVVSDLMFPNVYLQNL
jgi:hypothetical protein